MLASARTMKVSSSASLSGPSSCSKSPRESASSVQLDLATIVAARGSPVSSAISPKQSPGPSVCFASRALSCAAPSFAARWLLMSVTLTVPAAIM